MCAVVFKLSTVQFTNINPALLFTKLDSRARRDSLILYKKRFMTND